MYAKDLRELARVLPPGLSAAKAEAYRLLREKPARLVFHVLGIDGPLEAKVPVAVPPQAILRY
ncbi:MAG: hypothetical protein HY554_09995 [Elusimicrobia bacterium]|nr:hypothetical protein [Elusimicrobiota bacterium]